MRSETIVFSVTLKLDGNDIESVVELLTSGIGRIEANSACCHCHVSRDAVEENLIHYSETWAAEKDFRQYVASDEFRRILAAMDMCVEEPSVMVGNLSGHAGLEHLQKLCSP